MSYRLNGKNGEVNKDDSFIIRTDPDNKKTYNFGISSDGNGYLFNFDGTDVRNQNKVVGSKNDGFEIPIMSILIKNNQKFEEELKTYCEKNGFDYEIKPSDRQKTQIILKKRMEKLIKHDEEKIVMTKQDELKELLKNNPYVTTTQIRDNFPKNEAGELYSLPYIKTLCGKAGITVNNDDAFDNTFYVKPEVLDEIKEEAPATIDGLVAKIKGLADLGFTQEWVTTYVSNVINAVTNGITKAKEAMTNSYETIQKVTVEVTTSLIEEGYKDVPQKIEEAPVLAVQNVSDVTVSVIERSKGPEGVKDLGSLLKDLSDW